MLAITFKSENMSAWGLQHFVLLPSGQKSIIPGLNKEDFKTILSSQIYFYVAQRHKFASKSFIMYTTLEP